MLVTMMMIIIIMMIIITTRMRHLVESDRAKLAKREHKHNIGETHRYNAQDNLMGRDRDLEVFLNERVGSVRQTGSGSGGGGCCCCC